MREVFNIYRKFASVLLVSFFFVSRTKVWLKEGAEEEEKKMQLHMKHNVPNDIIVEILLRLPAKSLLRLRWACKYCFNLITRDDDFIKMHLHGSTTNHDEILNISSSIIFMNIIHKSGEDVGCDFFQCLVYNDITRVVNISSEVYIDLPFHYPLRPRPRILGSCNGLILLYQIPSLCVWNPCTKEYRLLPHPLHLKFQVSNLLFGGEDKYGFGYDRTTDDYKVIKTTYCHLKNQEFVSHVQVYTLGTNKWRSIKPYPNRIWCAGVFANGALYWIDYNDDTISFDIGKEEFQHVSKNPNCITNYRWYKARLQEFEGSLCIVLQSKDQQKWDMWVMKDYAPDNNNHNSSWFKLSPIECLRESEYPLKPLRFTRNGEILMVRNNEDLVLHDPKNNKDKTLCKIGEQPSCFEKVYYTITESLVSLYSGTYTGQEQKRNKKNKKM